MTGCRLLARLSRWASPGPGADAAQADQFPPGTRSCVSCSKDADGPRLMRGSLGWSSVLAGRCPEPGQLPGAPRAGVHQVDIDVGVARGNDRYDLHARAAGQGRGWMIRTVPAARTRPLRLDDAQSERPADGG